MDERPIHKLTQEPVSEEFLNVLGCLRKGEEVPLPEIEALPEIKFANACISNSKPTIEIDGREIIQENVYNRLQKMGSAVTQDDGTVSLTDEVHCEKRLDIVIGLPAAGKSSAVAEPISEMFKSRLIDCDEAKKMLPGFDGGWGAQAVHKESQTISNRQFKAALKKGENITYPRVGAGYDAMKTVIDEAKKFGYKVYLHYNELDRNKALGRMFERFLTTGRYLSPNLIVNHGDDISDTYRQLKKSGLLDGFSKWNNDVPFGERPLPVEHSPSCVDVYEALIKEKPGAIKDKIELHDALVENLTAEIEKLKADLRETKAKLDKTQARLNRAEYAYYHMPDNAQALYRQALKELKNQKAPTRDGDVNTKKKPPKPPGSSGSSGSRH